MHGTNDHPVADTVTSVAEGRTPLLEEPEAFVLSRLQGAGVRMAKRRFEAGKRSTSVEIQTAPLLSTEGVPKLRPTVDTRRPS